MAELFNAAELAAEALELIVEFGEPSTLRTFPPPTENPSEPWRPTVAGSGHTDQDKLSVVYLPQLGINRQEVVYADGTAQRIGDLKLLVGNDAVPAPDIGSIFIRGDGSQWKVKNVEKLAPNGVVLIYTLWAQR